jgi:hypothetical protein
MNEVVVMLYFISAEYDDTSLFTGIKMFVFKRNTIYCSTVFINRIENEKCKKKTLQSKLNVKTSSHQHKIYLPSGSSLSSNEDSARRHHRHLHSRVCSSCCQSRHGQNLISIFSGSSIHAWGTLAVVIWSRFYGLFNDTADISDHVYT